MLEQLVLMLSSVNAMARCAAAACLCDLALSGAHPAQCVAQVSSFGFRYCAGLCSLLFLASISPACPDTRSGQLMALRRALKHGQTLRCHRLFVHSAVLGIKVVSTAAESWRRHQQPIAHACLHARRDCHGAGGHADQVVDVGQLPAGQPGRHAQHQGPLSRSHSCQLGMNYSHFHVRRLGL